MSRRPTQCSCLRALIPTLALLSCGARTDLRADQQGSLEPSRSSRRASTPDEPDQRSLRCDSPSFDFATDPATVLLLIDRSGSMTAQFGGDTRWNVVGDALFQEQDGLVARLVDSARFGLAFYTSFNGFAGGSCPMMDYTSPVLGDPDLLREVFDATVPLVDGDTPTGEAIHEALDWLDRDEAAGPRYLVLITDGEPDTCLQPDPQNGQELALEAARAAHERGIETYVVGVSSDVGETHLQEMTNVAQGVRASARWGQDDEAIEPIVASEQDDVLARQIQGALGDVRSCTIALDADVDLTGTFVVELDGQTVPATDHAVMDGQLVLSGDTCARVLEDAKTLDVEVPCLATP